MDGKNRVLRPYAAEDLEQVLALFFDAVQKACAKEYTKAQRDAWADGNPDKEAWQESLLAQDAWVVEEEGQILAFGDRAEGYIDRLYVSPKAQGQGLGKALLQRLEERAQAQVLTVHASLTAEPFFASQDYHRCYLEEVERKGVLLPRYRMKKGQGQCRLAKEEDKEPLCALWLSGNRKAHDFVPADVWKEALPALWPQMQQAEVLVWEENQKIVGFCGLVGEEVAGLFVEEAYQREGIGAKLLAEAKQRRDRLTLHVFAQNTRAKAFYEREGFLAAEEQDGLFGQKEWNMVWRRS